MIWRWRPRVTLGSWLAAVAIFAVAFASVRPISAAEALRSAVDVAKKAEPGFRTEDYQAVVVPDESPRAWRVYFIHKQAVRPYRVLRVRVRNDGRAWLLNPK